MPTKSQLEITTSYTENRPHSLTIKQRAVLQLLAEGMTQKEIARVAGVTPNTVHIHVTDIMTRLNANNAVHAVAIGLRKEIIV